MKDELTLYEWIEQNNMTIKGFSEKIGCHRQTPRLVQCGKSISLRIALAIRVFTDGKINPSVKNVGRPRLYKQIHKL